LAELSRFRAQTYHDPQYDYRILAQLCKAAVMPESLNGSSYFLSVAFFCYCPSSPSPEKLQYIIQEARSSVNRKDNEKNVLGKNQNKNNQYNYQREKLYGSDPGHF
jgi:hypothetical protein